MKWPFAHKRFAVEIAIMKRNCFCLWYKKQAISAFDQTMRIQARRALAFFVLVIGRVAPSHGENEILHSLLSKIG